MRCNRIIQVTRSYILIVYKCSGQYRSIEYYMILYSAAAVKLAIDSDNINAFT